MVLDFWHSEAPRENVKVAIERWKITVHFQGYLPHHPRCRVGYIAPYVLPECSIQRAPGACSCNLALSRSISHGLNFLYRCIFGGVSNSSQIVGYQVFSNIQLIQRVQNNEIHSWPSNMCLLGKSNHSEIATGNSTRRLFSEDVASAAMELIESLVNQGGQTLQNCKAGKISSFLVTHYMREVVPWESLSDFFQGWSGWCERNAQKCHRMERRSWVWLTSRGSTRAPRKNPSRVWWPRTQGFSGSRLPWRMKVMLRMSWLQCWHVSNVDCFFVDINISSYKKQKYSQR